MPLVKPPSAATKLSALTVEALKDRIRDLNSKGHHISTTGNKSILVQRLINAERSNDSLPMPDISDELISSSRGQIRLADSIRITNEAEKEYAAQVIRGLVSLANKIKAECDPNIENWKDQVASAKKGLRDARAFVAKYVDPINEKVGLLKSRVNKYELALDAKREEEARKAQAEINNIAEDLIREEIAKLYEEDSPEADAEAERLESSLYDQSSRQQPVIHTPHKARGITTKIVFNWKLLDASRLRCEYTKIIPDMAKITTAVNKHGLDAVDVVGQSSIKVWKEARTRSTGR